MKHVVITGAADGIGKALALRFGLAGYRVTGLDRDTTRAQATAAELAHLGIASSFIAVDLAQPTEVQTAAEQLSAGLPIDVLIHNAGISAVGRFLRSDLVQQHAVLAVNLQAPLLLTAELLHRQALADKAGVILLSSLSHFVGYPGAAVYAATKDGLAAYGRSLAVAHPELHVLTVFPGPTRTAHARRYSPDNRREHRRMPPEQLAELIFRAVVHHRRILIPGWPNQLTAVLGYSLPRLGMLIMRKTILDKFPERSS